MSSSGSPLSTVFRTSYSVFFPLHKHEQQQHAAVSRLRRAGQQRARDARRRLTSFATSSSDLRSRPDVGAVIGTGESLRLLLDGDARWEVTTGAGDGIVSVALVLVLAVVAVAVRAASCTTTASLSVLLNENADRSPLPMSCCRGAGVCRGSCDILRESFVLFWLFLFGSTKKRIL
jgi:hypothetical protein